MSKQLRTQPEVNVDIILSKINGIEQMLGNAQHLGSDHENYELLYCEIADDIASIKGHMKLLIWSKSSQDLPARYDRCHARFAALDKPQHNKISSENRHIRSKQHVADVAGYYKTYVN